MRINFFPIFVILLVGLLVSLVTLGIKSAVENEQKIHNSKKYKPDDDVVLRLTNIKAVIIDHRIMNGKNQYHIKYVDPEDNDIEETYVYESELKLSSK